MAMHKYILNKININKYRQEITVNDVCWIYLKDFGFLEIAQ